MYRLRNNIKKSSSDKEYILGFRFTVSDETPIKLPKGERWTLHFTENYLFIGFGRRENGEYRYNPKAVERLQRRYPDCQLGVWRVRDSETSFSSLESRLLSSLDGVELSVSDDEDEEFYNPITGCFYRESDLAERGDCHPVPLRSKESLDRELEEYATERDFRRELAKISSFRSASRS